MELKLRGMRPDEQKYSYTQSRQLLGQTGCVGHIRGNMGEDGNGFFPSWEDHCSILNTPAFRSELENAVGMLRSDPSCHGILKNRQSLRRFCREHPELVMEDERSYGLRADGRIYAFLLRLNPEKGEYSFYLYAYKKERLDSHLLAAKRGIRFIDTGYREQFRIPDGGKILLTRSDGSSRTETCRYIDEYHLTTDSGLFHICEFADMAERGKYVIRPVSGPLPGREKEARYAGTGR